MPVERELETADLPPGSPCHLDDLKGAGVKTAAALWERLARDEWAIQKLLDEMNARRTAVARPLRSADLLEVFAVLAEREAARPSRPWWPGLRSVLLMLLFVVLLYVAWPLARPRSSTRHQYTAASGLPPYHVIGPDDVRGAEMPLDPRAAAGGERVFGWYSSRALAKGDLILEADLRDARPFADFEDRVILTVPVGPVDAALSQALPARVSLLFADAAGTAIPPLENVYLLALARPPAAPSGAEAATEATVALTAAELAAVRPFLRVRSITVAWTPPR